MNFTEDRQFIEFVQKEEEYINLETGEKIKNSLALNQYECVVLRK